MNNQTRLSPPQYTYNNFLKHSIGNDPCVTVSDIKEITEADLLVEIDARCRDKAVALATILELEKEFSNYKMEIHVLFRGQKVNPIEESLDAKELLKIIDCALKTNHYYETTRALPVPSTIQIFPIFKKEVVQFFNDDISDFYANFNGVAADVFREVLKFKIDETIISPSTKSAKTTTEND